MRSPGLACTHKFRSMHIILGAGGPISNSLTGYLLKQDQKLRLVSRRKLTRFESAEWVGADLKNGTEVLQAVRGATVIYMCAGLKYDKKIWAVEWPLIAQNLINAANEAGARLIFFDNVYAYGKVNGPMTEATPYQPSSVKGEIRAKIARQIMDEDQKGHIKASICRAADFYGSETLNSFFDSMVLANFAKGKKAMWLGNPEARHSLTYVPDAGRALYLLGNDPASSGQVWHAPTAPALIGKAYIELAAKIFGVPPKFTTVNKFMLQLIGLFNKPIGEAAELYYQNASDYIFDSSKFEKHFGVSPTTYEAGVSAFRNNKFLNR